MVERVVADRLGIQQRVPLDPVEGIVADGLLGVVARHLLVAPPAFAALAFEEFEDRLPGRELEGQVGRHARGEVLGLVMDEEVDVAKADAQQAVEQILREWQQPVRAHMHRAVPLRRLDRIAAGAVVERRQDDEIDFLFDSLQRICHHQRVQADGQMLAMILEHAHGQGHRPVLLDRLSDLMRQHHLVTHLPPHCCLPPRLHDRPRLVWQRASGGSR